MSVKSPLFSATAQTFPVPVGDVSTCRLHISGYSLKNYKMFNPEGYTIMCETGKYCDLLKFFPNTNTIVLEGHTQSLLLSDFPQQFIPDLAKELNVSPECAVEKSVDFFSNKRVVVQPTGLQGKVYNTMRSIQNYAPVAYAYEAVVVAKTTGLTGLRIITGAPLTFVGVTYLGGLVCGYFAAVAGNNTAGTVLNFSCYVLTRPMWGVETTLNGLVLSPLSNATGFPLILNGTNEIMAGKGINIKDYAKIGIAFERLTNVTSKGVKRTKKIYKVIKGAVKSIQEVMTGKGGD